MFSAFLSTSGTIWLWTFSTSVIFYNDQYKFVLLFPLLSQGRPLLLQSNRQKSLSSYELRLKGERGGSFSWRSDPSQVVLSPISCNLGFIFFSILFWIGGSVSFTRRLGFHYCLETSILGPWKRLHRYFRRRFSCPRCQDLSTFMGLFFLLFPLGPV